MMEVVIVDDGNRLTVYELVERVIPCIIAKHYSENYEGIPITSIQSVLGHINADSTQKYIGVNVRQLRSCALEVTD